MKFFKLASLTFLFATLGVNAAVIPRTADGPIAMKRETWEEWGQDLAAYYTAKYASSQTKRNPETWRQWADGVADQWAQAHNITIDHNETTAGYKRETWRQWADSVADQWAQAHNITIDQNETTTAYKREPLTWEEWGKSVGNYYHTKYGGGPDAVTGLPQPTAA